MKIETQFFAGVKLYFFHVCLVFPFSDVMVSGLYEVESILIEGFSHDECVPGFSKGLVPVFHFCEDVSSHASGHDPGYTKLSVFFCSCPFRVIWRSAPAMFLRNGFMPTFDEQSRITRLSMYTQILHRHKEYVRSVWQAVNADYWTIALRKRTDELNQVWKPRLRGWIQIAAWGRMNTESA